MSNHRNNHHLPMNNRNHQNASNERIEDFLDRLEREEQEERIHSPSVRNNVNIPTRRTSPHQDSFVQRQEREIRYYRQLLQERRNSYSRHVETTSSESEDSDSEEETPTTLTNTHNHHHHTAQRNREPIHFVDLSSSDESSSEEEDDSDVEEITFRTTTASTISNNNASHNSPTSPTSPTMYPTTSTTTYRNRSPPPPRRIRPPVVPQHHHYTSHHHNNNRIQRPGFYNNNHNNNVEFNSLRTYFDLLPSTTSSTTRNNNIARHNNNNSANANNASANNESPTNIHNNTYSSDEDDFQSLSAFFPYSGIFQFLNSAASVSSNNEHRPHHIRFVPGTGRRIVLQSTSTTTGPRSFHPLELINRDFDERDYELLLQLDEYNGVKTNKTVEMSNVAKIPFVKLEQDCNCSICLEEMKEGTEHKQIPNCKHVFHQDCIDTWLKSYNHVCPVCRANINEIDFKVVEEQEKKRKRLQESGNNSQQSLSSTAPKLKRRKAATTTSSSSLQHTQ
ncbi:hypothetical protein ABK040_007689 [Willaertia magna]